MTDISRTTSFIQAAGFLGLSPQIVEEWTVGDDAIAITSQEVIVTVSGEDVELILPNILPGSASLSVRVTFMGETGTVSVIPSSLGADFIVVSNEVNSTTGLVTQTSPAQPGATLLLSDQGYDGTWFITERIGQWNIIPTQV